MKLETITGKAKVKYIAKDKRFTFKVSCKELKIRDKKFNSLEEYKKFKDDLMNDGKYLLINIKPINLTNKNRQKFIKLVENYNKINKE